MYPRQPNTCQERCCPRLANGVECFSSEVLLLEYINRPDELGVTIQGGAVNLQKGGEGQSEQRLAQRPSRTNSILVDKVCWKDLCIQTLFASIRAGATGPSATETAISSGCQRMPRRIGWGTNTNFNPQRCACTKSCLPCRSACAVGAH